MSRDAVTGAALKLDDRESFFSDITSRNDSERSELGVRQSLAGKLYLGSTNGKGQNADEVFCG